VLLPAWDIWVTDVFLQGQPLKPVRRPDPVGIAAHEGVAVPKKGNVEPAMAYVNELLSLESQNAMPEIVGTGPTHQDAELPSEIQDFGAPTIEDVRDGSLKTPSYEFMWENQDGWGERWSQIFAE
jgi:spermidine/putrescine-binding protein